MATELMKFRGYYEGTKAEFIANAKANADAQGLVVYIQDKANNGAGACIYAQGSYFANFQELINALAFVKGVKVGTDSYNAANGGGYVEFATTDPSKLALDVQNGKLTFGLTEAFVKSVNDVIAQAAEIAGDYLTSADRTTLEGLITTAKSEAKSEAIAEVKGNAETDTKDSLTIEGVRKYVDDKTSGIASDAVVSEISGRVKAIEDDYLKAVDKTELQGAINTEKGRVDAIVADYLKATDKTELGGKIKSNTDAIATLNGNSSVEGSVDKKVADAINDFATKVSDNQTVDTFKELIDYAAEHGAEFSELVGEVDANAKAIQTLNGDSSVAGSVDKKVADAMASEVERADNLYATKQNLTDGVAEAKSHAEAKAAEFAGAAETNAKGYTDTNFVKKEGYVAYSEAEKTKLAGIAEGAQVNVIESVEVNGVAATVTGKNASVAVDCYTQQQTDDKLSEKANAEEVYTKTELNNMMSWVKL